MEGSPAVLWVACVLFTAVAFNCSEASYNLA